VRQQELRLKPQRIGAMASRGSGSPKIGILSLQFLILATFSVKAQDSSDLESKVQRILEGRCWSCHNAELRTADLVLMSREDKSRKGKAGRPLYRINLTRA